MSLPKGVYSKDDCGKLKSKDSNHIRRSKQNTYHVVNKNIALVEKGPFVPVHKAHLSRLGNRD